MDFRGLIPSIFEKRITNLFESNCNSAILQFQSALSNHEWFVTAELLSSMGLDSNTMNVDEQTGELNVPQILLQYPPLAVLTNAFIKAFNELREFVTYSVMMNCKTILINAIQSTVHSIRKFNVSSHHYHTSSNRRSQHLRRRSSKNRMRRKLKKKKKKISENKPQSVKDERRRSMANIPTDLDNDIKEDDEEDLLDEMDEEIDEVLANLVKVECEYLLPFLCDVFDLMFDRRKEIEIDDLLEYFVGLYSVPEFVTVSDRDDDDDEENMPESKTESKPVTDGANSNKSTESDSEQVTFVNNDVDDS